MINSDQGLIFQIQKMSTEDGPGIRTTVFFKQCPLKCIWCHNPESILKEQQLEWLEHKCIGCNTCIETCEQNALSFDENGLKIDRDKCNRCGECANVCPSTALHMWGEWWTLEDLYHDIQKDKVYYTQSNGGITVSGGEPTVQSKFIVNFLKKCQENEISTALDTCGYASGNIYKEILPHVDLVLLDIKEIDPKVDTDSAMLKSKVISADVNAAVTPNYTEVFELKNASSLGNGIVMSKYTGYGGKFSGNDASAEYVAEIRTMLNKEKIPWQTAELGRVDNGGGGTVAKYFSRLGMEVIDLGPAVMSMHSPFEVTSKVDIYASYLAYKAFFKG